MKKVVILWLALSAWLLCAATGVRSVRSADTSQTANTVSIELSDPAQYSVENLPGGNGIRMTIKEVRSLDGSPQYPRLSKVIDSVSARMDGNNAIIEIKTMGDFDITHQANSAKNRITVSINSAVPVPAVPQPAESPAQTPKTFVPSGAVPKKVGQPEVISRRPVPPPPQPTSMEPAVPQPTLQKPAPETAMQSELPVRETTEMNTSSQTIPDTPANMTSESTPATPDPDQPVKARSNLPLYLIIAGAVVLGLWVIHKFLLRQNPAEVPHPSVTEVSATPVEGKTLLLDPETRHRMVQKLLNQGWSSSQIAREMRLGVQEVERIVAKLKGGKR